MIEKIETLAQAEEVLKESPYMYLVSFITGMGHGSTIVASKEELPLYKVYFMINEANKEKQVLTITHITRLTD